MINNDFEYFPSLYQITEGLSAAYLQNMEKQKVKSKRSS